MQDTLAAEGGDTLSTSLKLVVSPSLNYLELDETRSDLIELVQVTTVDNSNHAQEISLLSLLRAEQTNT